LYKINKIVGVSFEVPKGFYTKFRLSLKRGLCYSIKNQFFKVILNRKSKKKRIRKLMITTFRIFNKFFKVNYLDFILKILDDDVIYHSQLGQDLFVLETLKQKKNGFFIEIGAGNGKYLSNTYLLEREYDWDGILVEPNKSSFKDCTNLRHCKVINKLILNSKMATVLFHEKRIGEFSFSEGYGNNNSNDVIDSYEIEAIRFEEIFRDFSSIPDIDFLSIDTEGSEVEILSSIDFSKYRPNIICIEHNYVKTNRVYIKNFLKSNGYIIVYSGVSMWDSWFVRKPNVRLKRTFCLY
jgi:FkbM family methyltransferase